jgi:hypothetical protein
VPEELKYPSVCQLPLTLPVARTRISGLTETSLSLLLRGLRGDSPDAHAILRCLHQQQAVRSNEQIARTELPRVREWISCCKRGEWYAAAMSNSSIKSQSFFLLFTKD